jgi:hypothetical protein
LIRDTWVIVTDSGGTAEDVVEQVNGNIVAINDKEEFKHAVISRLNVTAYDANPYKGDIRFYSEQAVQLRSYYESIL